MCAWPQADTAGATEFSFPGTGGGRERQTEVVAVSIKLIEKSSVSGEITSISFRNVEECSRIYCCFSEFSVLFSFPLPPELFVDCEIPFSFH